MKEGLQGIPSLKKNLIIIYYNFIHQPTPGIRIITIFKGSLGRLVDYNILNIDLKPPRLIY